MHSQVGLPIVFPEERQAGQDCNGSAGAETSLTVCASSVKFSPARSTMKPRRKMGQYRWDTSSKVQCLR